MKHKNDSVFNDRLYSKQKFGFRKLSIGLVAATLGTTFFLSEGQLVHADERSQAEQLETNTNSNSDINNKDTSDHNNIDTINSNTGNTQTEQKEAPAPTLSQKQPQLQATSSTTVETKATNEKGNETATVKPDQTKEMMAGQDTVNVHIRLNNLKPTDRKISFNFSNVGNDKFMNFNTHTLDAGTTTKLDDNWDITNNGNGTLITTWNNQDMDPESLNLFVPLQGNTQVVKDQATNPFEVTLKIDKSSGDESFDVLNAKITPYKDHIKQDEIVKGFAIGKTTVAKEKDYSNISNEDIIKNNIQDDQTVLQWGIYFNYGKGNAITNPDLKPLMDATFNVNFGGAQILLPSSIRVYQVPDNMIVDNNGNRHGEGDPYPGGGSYYDEITKYNNYRPDFVKYLQEHVNGNDIKVDQSKNGIFSIPTNNGRDEDYSRHAYFIQIDTLLSPNQTQPGSGETITYQSFYGQGKTIDNGHQSWTSEISGNGSGINFNKEHAHLTFYDDTIGKFINPENYHVDIIGDPETEINFGDASTNIYNEIIGKHYIFNGVTIGKEAKGILIKDNTGNIMAFAPSGIYATFDNTDNRKNNTLDSNPQYFVVHFVHDIDETQETKSLNETISYIDENTGNSIYPKFTSPILIFTRMKKHDKVTNTTTYSDWKSGNLSAVNNPDIPGYVIDANKISEKLNNNDSNLLKKNAEEIAGISFTQDEINAFPQNSVISVIVPYINNPPTTPIEPKKPTSPTSPSNPETPPAPETPTQPSTPLPNPNQTNTVKPKAPKVHKSKNRNSNNSTINHTITKKRNHTTTNMPKTRKIIPSHHNTKTNNTETFKPLSTTNLSLKKTLPHTGEKKTNLNLIGLALLFVASILGLTKKRKEN